MATICLTLMERRRKRTCGNEINTAHNLIVFVCRFISLRPCLCDDWVTACLFFAEVASVSIGRVRYVRADVKQYTGFC